MGEEFTRGQKIILFCTIIILFFTIIYMLFNGHNSLYPSIESFNTALDVMNTLDTQIQSDTTAATNFKMLFDPQNAKTNYGRLNSDIAELKALTPDFQFYMDQVITNKKISDLNTQINNLRPAAVSSVTPNVLSIKNPSSGLGLNIANSSDGNVLIYANGQCLKYNGSASYELADCNMSDTRQNFRLTTIANTTDYNNTISNNSYRLTSDNAFDTLSAFDVVLPPQQTGTNNPKECLSVANGGNLVIKPCTLLLDQRWNPMSKKLSC